jgi:heme exporter protein CcmD
MLNWLQNPQADYVIAAYGAAVVALFGLLVFSTLAARRKRREWQRVQEKRGKGRS